MPTNHYFQGGDGIGSTSEKRLMENLIIEGLKIYGHDVYYLPRTLVNKDLILGEDVASKFNAAYLCEMYMDTTDGFGTDGELISKFGLELRDDTTFTVSKRRWDDLVEDPATLIKSGRPNEGDIIYMPLMNSFWEILFVEDQEPFFQLGNLPVYKLRVTRFEYASERLDTGVSTIDAAEDKYSLDQLLHQMTLENEDGSLLLENDKASGEPNYFLMETYALQTQSPYASSIDLDTEAGFDTSSTADDILDFTERNPFGEVDF